jgi:hypothetical protein
MESLPPDSEAQTVKHANALEYARPAAPNPRGPSVCTEDPPDPAGDVFNRASMGAMIVIMLLVTIVDFVHNGGDPAFFAYVVFVMLLLIAAAVFAVREHLRRVRSEAGWAAPRDTDLNPVDQLRAEYPRGSANEVRCNEKKG